MEPVAPFADTMVENVAVWTEGDSRGVFIPAEVAAIMAKSPQPRRGPNRIAPSDALPDVVERLVPRRQFQPEDGDVLITRERIPRVNPFAQFPLPWRYRLAVRGGMEEQRTFNSFQHAAFEAEQIASKRNSRVVYIEDDTPTVLGDYRG